MSFLTSFFSPTPKVQEDSANSPRVDYEPSYGRRTQAGQVVSVYAAQCIATAYRAKNIISDSVASMPFKHYHREGSNAFEVSEDPITRNMAYLLQVQPNDWGWTPFQLKKSVTEWLLFYGNGYIWNPPVAPAQMFVLNATRTRPLFDLEGNLWYEHRFPNSNKPAYIPAVEILHLMINPDDTGMVGRGVITFARETFGRRLAANKAQSMLHAQGFMPAAVMKMKNEVNKEQRDRIRSAYEESMSGTDNAYRLAIIDNKVEQYTPVEMQLKDSNWLESIDATDDDIALFFGIAGHMLNRGKEAYNSNAEKFEEFKALTLDPFLIPWEQAARIRWLSRDKQGTDYFKFKREALLRMSPKERAEMNATKIQSGQLTPNESRAQDELNAYPLGDQYFMAANIAPLKESAGVKPDAQQTQA